MVKNNKNAKLYNLLLLLNTTTLLFSLGKKIFKLLPNIDELFSRNTDLTTLGLSAEEIIRLKNPDWRVVEEALSWAEEDGRHIITISDASYPELLKEIPNPPLVLFVLGDLSLLKSSQLAIVGSRNPTPVGVEVASDFASMLVQAGLVITSGLAMGIDAASHWGAIKSSGKTIAVMGTGLNCIYPSRHTKLAEKIVATGGVLLSEFPLNVGADAWHFPLRNRIISGLSIGTLVVEATIRSGSLITARLAGEQGREVFAIPGAIYNPASRGCHYLIRQGAKLVEQATDILEELPNFTAAKQEQASAGKAMRIKNKLDCEHKKLLDCMGFEITTIDILAARINLPVLRINIMLLELELQGLIKATIGGYIRTGY